MMRNSKYLLPLALVSLFYNFIVISSVTLNLDWVRTRAAGGQFDTFPTALRILYFVMALLTLFLARWLWNQRNGVSTERNQKIARLLAILFTVSTCLQLISRSNDERWNALPAIILAITFGDLVKRFNQSHREWRPGESNP